MKSSEGSVPDPPMCPHGGTEPVTAARAEIKWLSYSASCTEKYRSARARGTSKRMDHRNPGERDGSVEGDLREPGRRSPEQCDALHRDWHPIVNQTCSGATGRSCRVT